MVQYGVVFFWLLDRIFLTDVFFGCFSWNGSTVLDRTGVPGICSHAHAGQIRYDARVSCWPFRLGGRQPSGFHKDFPRAFWSSYRLINLSDFLRPDSEKNIHVLIFSFLAELMVVAISEENTFPYVDGLTSILMGQHPKFIVNQFKTSDLMVTSPNMLLPNNPIFVGKTCTIFLDSLYKVCGISHTSAPNLKLVESWSFHICGLNSTISNTKSTTTSSKGLPSLLLYRIAWAITIYHLFLQQSIVSSTAKS